MQRYNDVPKQSNVALLSRGRAVTSPLALPLLIMAVTLTFASLACAFIGTGSRSIADMAITRLPTLTRTPLPSLTPTALATSVAMALSAEVTPAVPTSLSPVPAVPTAAIASSEISEATTAPVANIPVASTDSSIANPTATATVPMAATATAMPLPTDTPTLMATETPLPTDTPTTTPVPQDWMFSGARVYSDQYEGGLLVYGNVTNNTSAAQELLAITGTFYDAQGQVIAGTDRIYAYWPGYVIPPGGHVPFEITVDGINGAANFDLAIEATPSDEVPHQNFEIADVSQWNEDNVYCLKGKLHNPASALQDYLIIAAVLYDAQNNVINFGDYEEFGLTMASAGDTSEFEVCVEPPNQNVARYEVQAWGR